jgi:hypothetical protein
MLQYCVTFSGHVLGVQNTDLFIFELSVRLVVVWVFTIQIYLSLHVILADFVCHVYHIVAFSVHAVGYSRNASCALNLISTLYYSQGIDTSTGGLLPPGY